MSSVHCDYLEGLERKGGRYRLEQMYLWPRTPTHDLQGEIARMVGVPDTDSSAANSRPAIINDEINSLIRNGLLPSEATVLDIACGDGLVLSHIRDEFSATECYGVDCNKDKYSTHAQVKGNGVSLYRVFIQHLFRSHPAAPFDLVIMLNTYRGWQYAALRWSERNLPRLADEWFARHARHVILTAVPSQVVRLRELGFVVTEIGHGEEGSLMIRITPEPQARPARRRFLVFPGARPVWRSARS